MINQKEPLLVVSKKQDIVYLTLNRPRVLNALSSELLHQLKSIEGVNNIYSVII